MYRQACFWSLALACASCQEEEVEAPTFEEGQAWKVDLASGVLESPPNMDELNDFLVSDYPFYLGIENVGKTSLGVMFGIAAEGGEGQDMCSRTITMPDVSLKNDKELSYGPDTFVMANGITTLEMTLSGVFSDDLTTLEDMAVTGMVVVESVPEDILILPGDLTACGLLEAFDVPCLPCPDGVSNCIDFSMSDVVAHLSPSVTLEPVLDADCHEACDKSDDNPDCPL